MDIELLSLGDHLPHPLTGELRPQPLRLRSIVEAAVLAEELGFSGIALGEHHFGRYIVSAPELLLSAIAVRTSRIRLGTAVTLLAHLDAVRAAEQLNTLDVLSQGRAQLTAARGVSMETCVAFGSPSEELRLRFDENLRLLLRLLTEDEVTWSGRFRTPLQRVHIVPRCVQQPHPPIWVGGGLSSVSADLAAELGLPLMLPSMFWHPDHYVPLVERYREAMRARGYEQKIRVGAASHVHVGSSTAVALSRWRPHLHAYATFANDLRGDGTPVDVDKLLQGPAVCGDPEEVTARLRAIQEALGLDVHLVMFDVGGLPEDEVFASLALFGREVLPRERAERLRGKDAGVDRARRVRRRRILDHRRRLTGLVRHHRRIADRRLVRLRVLDRGLVRRRILGRRLLRSGVSPRRARVRLADRGFGGGVVRSVHIVLVHRFIRVHGHSLELQKDVYLMP